MIRKILSIFYILLLISFNSFGITTVTNNTSASCVAPTGYTILECMDDKTIGETYLVYKAENTSSATTATVALDPKNSANNAILFSNKNYGHYLKLNVVLPCNRTLNDYQSISFKVLSVAGIGTYQTLRVGINQNMFDVANNGSNTLTSWTTIERAFPAGFSTYSALNTFSLNLGFRTSAKDYYIDEIMLKEKAGLSPCGGANLFTVNLNPGNGSCVSASLTETEEGSGVILPVATPSAKCGVDGYTFAGWATSAVTETGTQPVLIAAGAWAITQNTTLYAVYTKDAVYNSNPVCSVSENGTVTSGWLMAEDFESKTLTESLEMKNVYAGPVVGTATVAANPTVAEEKSAHIVISSGNYNTLLKLNLTLPVGKVLANYEQLSFDIYRMAGDANYKKMYIWVDGAKVFEDGSYIQQAPTTTWTTKTYNLTNLSAGNTFEIDFGISTDAGNYLIDNVKLKEKVVTNTFTVAFNPGAGTCTTTSLTENTPSSGVTLPTAIPSTEAGSNGWTFVGWSLQAVHASEVAPVMNNSSTVYFPTVNLTMFAVYLKNGIYHTYPTTATSSNGVIQNKILMLEDFETKQVGTMFNIFNFGGNSSVGTANITLNPANLNERSVQLITNNYENIAEFELTLPEGKTLSAFDQLLFDFYWKTNDWKKMFIYVDRVKVYEDNDYISQSAVNQWTSKTYAINLNSGNNLKLAIGISTDAGDYFLDNIRLRETITTLSSTVNNYRFEIKDDKIYFSTLTSCVIYNIKGEPLLNCNNILLTDISILKSGLYILKIKRDDNVFVEKFIR